VRNAEGTIKIYGVEVLTTISVVMNILMDTVLDTKSAMVLETSYRERYTIGLK
jgi:hypothetical protein